MIRVLLVLLAVLLAILALIFEQGWLYVVAGAALAGALVFVLRSVAPSLFSRSGRPSSRSSTPSSEDDREHLGIVGIREHTGMTDASSDDNTSTVSTPPRASSGPSSGLSSGEPTGSSMPHTDDPRPVSNDASPSSAPSHAATTPSASATPASASEDARPPSRTPASSSPKGGGPPATSASPSTPFISPYVQAVRDALDARMVALLVQEEMMAYEYRVRAVAGPPQHVAPGETVSTDQPLLTASTAHQPVTVHALDEDRRSDLFAYDANGSEVTCRALAPLRQHTSPDLSFLLVDAHADLDTSRARTMLEQFADTMALVLDANAHPALDVDASLTDDSSWDEDWSEDDVVGRDSPVADASRVPSDRPPPHDPEPDADVDNRPADEEEASPRPRREIIVEEMKVAYDDNLPLSLVLVHLNRAESLSETDTETVDACERHLRDYLQECAPESRVTRFGELTYGVFVNAPIDAVETWALELDAAFDRQEGLLRGGASIGVAVWNKEDDPDTLRANATEALREAYMSGYCTLID